MSEIRKEIDEQNETELNERDSLTAPDYYFGFGVGEHNLPSLEAVKTWMAGDERRFDTFTIAEYGTYDEAVRDEEELNGILALRGMERALQLAEQMAEAGGYLDPERTDGRVFFALDAPRDPFMTARQQALAQAVSLPDERFERLVDITSDETQELPALQPEPGSWDELVEQERLRRLQPEPERERAYWRLDTRPVETPEGDPQGYALVITVFPELPADFDQYVDENGIDDSIYPTHARRLAIAHFETEPAAERYQKEFRSYLVPGLLDGPELAEEAARLEGMPGTWQAMDYRDIVEDMSSHRSVAREADDRQVLQPNAEREAEMPSSISAPDLDF